MKLIIEKILLGIILISFISCDPRSKSIIKNSNETYSNKTSVKKDTFKIAESKNQIDNPVNEYLKEKLEPIRRNFKKLNSIENRNWSSLVTNELNGTNEDGEVTYYHWNNELDKIVTKEYGETFQLLTEYYLLKGKLSFVYEKLLNYNSPLYHDSLSMKAMNDKAIFDLKKSEIQEDRSYFDNGKLFHQLNSQDCGSPFADEYLQKEQIRIKNKFDKLIRLYNGK